MKFFKIVILTIIVVFVISCDSAIQTVSDKALKVVDDNLVKIDSAINKEVGSKINNVDSLIQEQKNVFKE